MDIAITGPDLPVQTCTRRLSNIQDDDIRLVVGDSATVGSADHAQQEDGVRLACDISWHGAAPFPSQRRWDDAKVQQCCGMMHVHGRQRGRPQRLGVELPSVASGMMASHGILAALVGQSRGVPISSVKTSVLEAGLLCLSQYIARATCGGDWDEKLPTEDETPGPPFPTADGHWIELETLSPESWRAFWRAIEVEPPVVVQGWKRFRPRYSTAVCHMPPTFHEATARRSLEELVVLARASGVSLTSVRTLDEVFADPRLKNADRARFNAATAPPATGSLGPRPRLGPPTSRPTGAPPLPLTGVWVIEATSRIQGPLAGQLLRLLGATVVRIEPPGGDIARMEAPLAGNVGAFFLAMNRGKDPIELDLKDLRGRTALLDLVSGADVFLHNWRPGRAADWSLDHTHMAARNPQLVYCEASGWGNMADDAPTLGMDFLVQAYSGLGDAVTLFDEPPAPSRLLVADFMGALLAVEGILNGLYRQTTSGRGSMVRTSLLAGAMALNAHLLDGPGAGERRRLRRHRPSVVEQTDSQDACDDLASLPRDALLGGLFEPLGPSGFIPASPWTFA